MRELETGKLPFLSIFGRSFQHVKAFLFLSNIFNPCLYCLPFSRFPEIHLSMISLQIILQSLLYKTCFIFLWTSVLETIRVHFIFNALPQHHISIKLKCFDDGRISLISFQKLNILSSQDIFSFDLVLSASMLDVMYLRRRAPLGFRSRSVISRAFRKA